jgi:hypothetical protein
MPCGDGASPTIWLTRAKSLASWKLVREGKRCVSLLHPDRVTSATACAPRPDGYISHVCCPAVPRWPDSSCPELPERKANSDWARGCRSQRVPGIPPDLRPCVPLMSQLLPLPPNAGRKANQVHVLPCPVTMDTQTRAAPGCVMPGRRNGIGAPGGPGLINGI